MTRTIAYKSEINLMAGLVRTFLNSLQYPLSSIFAHFSYFSIKSAGLVNATNTFHIHIFKKDYYEEMYIVQYNILLVKHSSFYSVSTEIGFIPRRKCTITQICHWRVGRQYVLYSCNPSDRVVLKPSTYGGWQCWSINKELQESITVSFIY